MVLLMGRPPATPKTPLAERLKSVRELVSAEDRDGFAEACGISKTAVGNYERGDSAPGAEALQKYHQASGVDLTWLITGEGEMIRSNKTSSAASDHPNLMAMTIPAAERHAFQQTMSRSTRSPDIDIYRLEKAILVVEQGLEEAERVATPKIKATLVSVAYEMLEKPSAEKEALILRLVKS